MNHIYRTIFNRSLGIFQVASELASGAGRQSSLKPANLILDAEGSQMPPSRIRALSAAISGVCPSASLGFMEMSCVIAVTALGAPNYAQAEIQINNNKVIALDDDLGTLGESIRIGDAGTLTVHYVEGHSPSAPAPAPANANIPIVGREVILGSGVNSGQGTINTEVRTSIGASSSLSGGTLVKEGAGTLAILTDNALYGDTLIKQGILEVAAPTGALGRLGAGKVTIEAGAKLGFMGNVSLANSQSNPFGNVIEGAGELLKGPLGSITLTGNNTYTGTTTIDRGRINIGNGGDTGTLGTGSVTIIGAGTLAFNRSDNVTVNNEISGSAGKFLQFGSGTTTLTGNTTYGGGTTISGGTLHISSAANIGTGGLTFSNGAVLQTDATVGSLGTRAIVMNAGGGTFSTASGSTLVVGGAVSGAGGLKAAGSGTLTLTGTNTYLGGTTVDGGKLSISNDSNLGAAGTGVTISNGASLEATATTNLGSRGVTLGAGGGTLGATGSSTDLTVGGVVSGTDLTTSGPGRVILTGNNTYDQTNISSGSTLQVGNGGTTGTLGTGAVTNDGTLTINRSDAITVGNDINGTGALNKTGTGTTTLTGTNGYTGTTTISAGTLQVGNGGTTGTLGSGNVVTNLGTGLVFDRSNEMTVNNVISGGGSVTQSGTGNTTLAGSNTYTGGTTIDGGTLSVSSNGNLGAVGTGVNISNGAALAATATTDLGSRGVTLGTGGGTLEAVGAGTNLTVGGVVSGTELTKAGEGTVILAGANTYTGGTTIDGGTLSISSDGNLGAAGSGVNINNGATLSSTASTDLGTRDVALGTGGGALEAAGGTILTVGGRYPAPT